MRISVYLPLLASLLLAAVARPLGRRLHPRTAAPALVVAAGLTATASTWALTLLAATLLRASPPVMERAGVRAVAVGEPVPDAIALGALLALGVGAYRLVEAWYRRRATLQALRGVCTDAGAELVVIAAAAPHAVAVPGRAWERGHILVTSGMLAALDDRERAVMLAHERAHLRRGHHWQQMVVDAAAAVNPLLRPVRATVAYLLERDADEAAADRVGSRDLAAQSLTRAALAASHPRGGRLAFEQLAVTARVLALKQARTPRRRLVAAAVVLLGVATTLAASDATLAFSRLVEQLLPGV